MHSTVCFVDSYPICVCLFVDFRFVFQLVAFFFSIFFAVHKCRSVLITIIIIGCAAVRAKKCLIILVRVCLRSHMRKQPFIKFINFLSKIDYAQVNRLQTLSPIIMSKLHTKSAPNAFTRTYSTVHTGTHAQNAGQLM